MPEKEKTTGIFEGQTEKTSFFDRFAHYIRAILIILIFLVTLMLIPRDGNTEKLYKPGDISQNKIVAPFRFDVLKPEDELRADRQQAQSSVLQVFVFQQNHTKIVVEDYFSMIKKLKQSIQQQEKSRQLFRKYKYSDKKEEARSALESDSMQVEIYYRQLTTEYRLRTKLSDWKNLALQYELDEVQTHQRISTQIINDILAEGVLDIPRDQIEARFINIEKANTSKKADKQIYHDLSSAWARAKQRLNLRLGEDADKTWFNIDYEIITKSLKPNYIYNNEKTQKRIKRAINQVPIVRGSVLKGEIIAEKGERITPLIFQKLISLASRKTETIQQKTWFSTARIWAGKMMIIVFVLFVFFSFLSTYRPKTYANIREFSFLIFILLFELIVSAFILQAVQTPIVQIYLIPITFAGMLGFIFFDSRLSIMLSLTVSFLVALLLPSQSIQLVFVLVSLLTVILANTSIRDLHQRRQIFQAILFIFGGYLLSIPIVSMMLTGPEHGQIVVYAGINAFLIPIVTYFIIWPLERFTKRTTDVTLFELSDLRHPLLKRLSLEAPGTFQHCTQVANLSEASAEAIGANSILCRVGAYYHDVGKINRPNYFIENQLPSTKNPHDNLKPNVSAIVIKNHVKDGVILAQKYKLPQEVINFVLMHHGRSLIRYFFQKAQENTEKSSKIREDDFRYDGPRANTKETGIVMICEIVEAAVRALKNPDRNKISARIDDIIQSRLIDGELSECPLTLLDLEKIKKAMVPILDGIYHGRIEYQKQNIPNH